MPSKKAAVLHGEIEELFNRFLLKKYPIGKLWISVNSTNPENIVGGKWEFIGSDTFIASHGITNAGNVGGSNNAINVSHSHTGSVSTTNGSFEAMNHSANPTGFVTYENLSSGPTGTLGNAGRYTLNHNHGLTINSAGSSGDNKNMPKYLACYIFKRIA